MANTNSEFVTAWNEIFSFKIAESDLRKPTEQFVFNALVSYLEQFDFNLRPVIEERPGDITFKIKLCQSIDHYYKLSDKSNAFLYIDLISPSPKKTAHVLKYLLNYWLYFNMMKNEIIVVGNEMVQEHADLLEMQKNFVAENEKLAIKEKTMEKSIKEFKEILPKLEAEIKSLQAEESAQMEKLRELKEICRNCESVLTHLKTTEEDLKRAVVSEDEVHSLRETEASLQKAVAEQEEVENATLRSNQTRSDKINRLAPLIKQITSTMEIHPLENFVSAKEAKQKLAEMKRKYSQQISMNEKRTADIEMYSKKLEELEQMIRAKMNELQALLIANEDKKQEYFIKIESEKKLRDILIDEENKLKEEYQSEVDKGRYIIELAKNFVYQVKSAQMITKEMFKKN